MKKIITLALAGLLVSSAFAEFGYQKGEAAARDRSAFFQKIGEFSTEAEREAYFSANGVGGDGPYHDAAHYDVEKLLSDGVIDSAQAEKLKAQASAKHGEISAKYASADREKMSKAELADFYKNLGK